jgi:hypothetical protein
MPVLETAQKGFYDVRRQFQGKDDPSRGDGAPAIEAPGTRPPVGQLVAGVVFLGLIVLAFLSFALPEKPIGLDSGAAKPAAATK